MSNAPRFAPLRYRTCHYDGWRAQHGYAIHLPAWPTVRICCRRDASGHWRLDDYRTGFGISTGQEFRSRRKLVLWLLHELPRLTARRRYLKRIARAQSSVRRALRLGQVR